MAQGTPPAADAAMQPHDRRGAVDLLELLDQERDARRCAEAKLKLVTQERDEADVQLAVAIADRDMACRQAEEATACIAANIAEAARACEAERAARREAEDWRDRALVASALLEEDGDEDGTLRRWLNTHDLGLCYDSVSQVIRERDRLKREAEEQRARADELEAMLRRVTGEMILCPECSKLMGWYHVPGCKLEAMLGCGREEAQ